jgi:hypothetical protein
LYVTPSVPVWRRRGFFFRPAIRSWPPVDRS